MTNLRYGIHSLYVSGYSKLLVFIALCIFSLLNNDAFAGNEVVSEESVQLSIDFPINKYEVNRDFSNNATSLDSIAAMLSRASSDSLYIIKGIKVTGAASPDGLLKKNLELAKRRMLATTAYLTNTYDVIRGGGVEISPGESYVPWDEFRALVAESGIPEADRVIAIASQGSDDSQLDALRRMTNLKRLNGSRTWRFLCTDILPRLRRAVVMTITIELRPEPVSEPEPAVAEPVVEEEIVAVGEVVAAEEPAPAPCPNVWHLSTNLIEWGMAISNLTAEVDFAPRWSAALSLHYSGMNYAGKTRKFRTFIFRPEVRWWAGSCHKGLFLDAHLQMAAYNFALPSWKYRIQDVGGKNPALGGGLGIGYRLPLGSNGHWAAQGQLGVGVYHLKYDRFENRPNGPLVDTRRRVWAGIDNVSVSIVYNFKASGR